MDNYTPEEDILSELKYSDLSEQQQAIVNCIGFEAYEKLINTFGGQKMYIPTFTSVQIKERDRQIKKAYNQRNITRAELGRRYGLSSCSVRRITKNSSHKDKDILDSRKQPIIDEYVSRGTPPAVLARKYNVSYDTIYRLIHKINSLNTDKQDLSEEGESVE